ncbi:MAG TPA: rhodanese-like domain-containing protein [Microthrixaceae bacterium]|nr:rhodanese-like domain-containing protein [Microthrixaceae bacterium]
MTQATRIDATTLQQWLADGVDVRVLDVRSPAEFDGVHIPGAFNVPLDTLGEHAEDIQRHVDQTVVLVCRSGMRASQAEQRLARTGMGNVKVLEGGMAAWERSGGKVNRGVAKWDIERQVRLVAGSIVFASIVASIWAPGMRFVAGAIGAGLTIAALTNTCAMGKALSMLPYNRGNSCDVNAVVDQLTGRA